MTSRGRRTRRPSVGGSGDRHAPARRRGRGRGRTAIYCVYPPSVSAGRAGTGYLPTVRGLQIVPADRVLGGATLGGRLSDPPGTVFVRVMTRQLGSLAGPAGQRSVADGGSGGGAVVSSRTHVWCGRDRRPRAAPKPLTVLRTRPALTATYIWPSN